MTVSAQCITMFHMAKKGQQGHHTIMREFELLGPAAASMDLALTHAVAALGGAAIRMAQWICITTSAFLPIGLELLMLCMLLLCSNTSCVWSSASSLPLPSQSKCTSIHSAMQPCAHPCRRSMLWVHITRCANQQGLVCKANRSAHAWSRNWEA